MVAFKVKLVVGTMGAADRSRQASFLGTFSLWVAGYLVCWLEVERVGELQLQGAVSLAVEHSRNPAFYVIHVIEQGPPPLVVNQKEIVSGPENIVQPEVHSEKGVGVVVLDDRAGEPLVVEIVVDASVDEVVGEISLGEGGFID